MDQTMTPMRIAYDSEFDVLEIFFHTPEPTLTVEFAEDMYAHFVPGQMKVIGSTIHQFRTKHSRLSLPFMGAIFPASSEIGKKLIPAY